MTIKRDGEIGLRVGEEWTEKKKNGGVVGVEKGAEGGLNRGREGSGI